MRISTVRTFLIGLSLAVAASAGCGGGGGKGTVSGEVKYAGRPLPSGTVTFLSQSGHQQVASADIVDGRYAIKDMETGNAIVTVVTIPPSKGGQPPHGKGIETPVSTRPATPFVRIPTKYANQNQSGITYEVKSGVQTKDFDLPR